MVLNKYYRTKERRSSCEQFSHLMIRSIAIPYTNDVLIDADTQHCPTNVFRIIKLVAYQRKKLKTKQINEKGYNMIPR